MARIFLAEHSAALAEEKRKASTIIEEREQQSEETIGAILEEAYRKKAIVKIQLNARENVLYKEDVVGVILGCEEENLYISNNAGTERVELSMIRNVECSMMKKWYN